MHSAAEMEPEQQILTRLASLEGRVLDLRAVVTLLLTARPMSPPCVQVPLPAFVRHKQELRVIPTEAQQISGRCTFWL